MKKIIIFAIFLLFITTSSFTQTQKEIGEILEILETSQKDSNVIEKNENISGVYSIYLDAPINSPLEYREIFELLNRVEEKDTVYIKINTPGGSAYTTIALVNSIKACKAVTIAEIQTAYSAGSIIALACKKQIVKKYATMMIHSLQLNIGGDINMLQIELNCFRKFNEDIIKNTFSEFLTNKEIEYILSGGVLWLNEDEIKTRLKIN